MIVNDFAILLATVTVCMVVDSALRSKAATKWKLITELLPASGISIIIGCTLAGILMGFLSRSEINTRFGFNVQVFNIFLLPASIFDGGYSLKQVGCYSNAAHTPSMSCN